MSLRVLMVCLLLLVFCTSVVAQEYYADVDIFVDETGLVKIVGDTNHPDLTNGIHDEFISKNKGYWLFDFFVPGTFSEYIYKVHLPKNTEINYIKTSGAPRIRNEAESLVITEIGSNKTMGIKIQYQIKKSPTVFLDTGLIVEITLVCIIFLMILLYFWKKRFSRKKIEISHLPERQAAIVTLLMKKKHKMLQSEIEKILGFPKSSLSRNIDALLRKGIVEKIERGKTNIIKIKEDKK